MDIQLLHPFFALTPPSALKFPSNYSPTEINDFLVNSILRNPHFQQYPPSDQYQRRFWKWAIETLEQLARGCYGQEACLCRARNLWDSHLALVWSRLWNWSPYIWPLSLLDASFWTVYISFGCDKNLTYKLLKFRTDGSNHPNVHSLACERGIPLQNGPPSQSYITHFWDFRTLLPSSSSNGSSTDIHSVTLLESRTTIESGTTGLRTWMASFALAQFIILHPGTCLRFYLVLVPNIGFSL